MTETAPVSWQSTPGTPLERLVATVGRIHPHVECKVVDPVTEETLPVGMTGELRTRGYNVMPGYFNNPEATVNLVSRVLLRLLYTTISVAFHRASSDLVY